MYHILEVPWSSNCRECHSMFKHRVKWYCRGLWQKFSKVEIGVKCLVAWVEKYAFSNWKIIWSYSSPQWKVTWLSLKCPFFQDYSKTLASLLRLVQATTNSRHYSSLLFWNFISSFSQRLFPASFSELSNQCRHPSHKPIFQTYTLSNLGGAIFYVLYLLMKNIFYAPSFLFIYELSASLTLIYYIIFLNWRVAWLNF